MPFFLCKRASKEKMTIKRGCFCCDSRRSGIRRYSRGMKVITIEITLKRWRPYKVNAAGDHMPVSGGTDEKVWVFS